MRVVLQVLLQKPFGIGVHGPELQATEVPVSGTQAPVSVQNWARGVEFYSNGYKHEQGAYQQAARHDPAKVQSILEPPRPGVQEVVLDLHPERPGEVPGNRCRVRDPAQGGDDHNVPEAVTRKVNELRQILLMDAGHGKHYGVYPVLPGQIRRVSQALTLTGARESVLRQESATVENGDGSEPQSPLFLQEPHEPHPRLSGTQQHDGLAPQSGLYHLPLYKLAHQRGQKQERAKAQGQGRTRHQGPDLERQGTDRS